MVESGEPVPGWEETLKVETLDSLLRVFRAVYFGMAAAAAFYVLNKYRSTALVAGLLVPLLLVGIAADLAIKFVVWQHRRGHDILSGTVTTKIRAERSIDTEEGPEESTETEEIEEVPSTAEHSG